MRFRHCPATVMSILLQVRSLLNPVCFDEKLGIYGELRSSLILFKEKIMKLLSKRIVLMGLAVILCVNFSAFAYADDTSNADTAYQITDTISDDTPLSSNYDTDSRTSTSSADIEEAFDKMSEIYSSENLANSSESDITVFWDMLAKKSLGLNSKVTVDFYSLDYSSMSSQVLAKVLITMKNNNFDTNSKVVNNSYTLAEYLQSCCINGEYCVSGSANSTMATEQVWVMLALSITHNDIPQEAWDYLFSMQNDDGGFGWGTWSDIGTTAWVLSLIELEDVSASYTTEISNMESYINSSLNSVISSKDTSSLSAYISCEILRGNNTEELILKLLDIGYNQSGYFTWGDSSDVNAYSTSTCTQALGEYFTGSVFTSLKQKNSSEESTSENITIDDLEAWGDDLKQEILNSYTPSSNYHDSSKNETITYETINNYANNSEPNAVTKQITKEIIRETPAASNSTIVVNAQPVTVLPDYRAELRIFLALLGIYVISYAVNTIVKVGN